jgi:N-acetylglucosaminyldiphosphoundecaprenol N-acetyl-beta-D-mannosaminyltransferase
MDLALPAAPRIRLMGAAMDALTAHEVMRFTVERVREGRKAIVANHNAHSLALVRRNRAMRDLYAMADVIEIDSMPLIAWGRTLGLGLRAHHRSTYLDWREDFWRQAQTEAWRIFYLGGRPGVAERAAAMLRRRWRGVTIAVQHGYFDRRPRSPANIEVVESINAFAPDVIFVGLGMPAQERWIAQNYEALERGVLFSIGAAFDYEAGVQIAAPRWEPWSLLPPAAADLRRALARPRRDPAPTIEGPGRVLE